MSNIKALKEAVCEANLELVRHNLVLFTWGNASAIDRERGLVVIKPSGVGYDQLHPNQMVVLDLEGDIVEGELRPSSDAPTHLVIYREFPEPGAIVHTHSTHATAWAQACRDIPSVGTTHADYFYREIPCTRAMNEAEVNGDYETETGNVIIECFRTRSLHPSSVPGVLVANHGPFAWGNDSKDAVHNAVVLEEVARMALFTGLINPEMPMNPLLIEKHYRRKHGPDSYYGQEVMF